jgi:hypothetical protein
MNDEFRRQLLERLKAIERRLDALDASQSQLKEAYARSRAHVRRLWLRPPMWTFEQHPSRPLDLPMLPAAPALSKQPPRIAIVTPTFNYARFLRATIDSVVGQNYPILFYHIQDAASSDGTVELLKDYGDRISWRSEPDDGQSDAINKGFATADCDIMAYLNSETPCCLARSLLSPTSANNGRILISYTDTGSSSIRPARKSAARYSRRTTARRSNTPAMFLRRPCSGAAVYGTRWGL